MIQCFSPIDGALVAERPEANWPVVDALLDRSVQAFRHWQKVPLEERIEMCRRFVACFTSKKGEIAREITVQMGRPIRYAAGEIRGFEDRANGMLAIAEQALSPIVPEPVEGFERWIQREPVGPVLVLAAWNYPYLIAVNTLIPALVAGNVVLLKHADQTLLCAERLADAAREAGLPGGVFQIVHMNHDVAAQAVADPRVQFVAFTGSVSGGQAVHRAAAGTLTPVGFELGGKDPAYVFDPKDLQWVAENLVEGAFFNSGQSCCGVERIYVHQDIYASFIEHVVDAARPWVLGNPLETATTLGPVVRPDHARFIRSHVDEAIRMGARPLLAEPSFSGLGPSYLPPQILVNVDHSMRLMREETFGPVVGIMSVKDDAEALSLMNDSPFGLTASLWTQDVSRAKALASGLQTGTVFLNRCDYLDPQLAWVGAKLSGPGCTLSSVGYEHLTRPKSFHFRLGV